MKTIYRKVKKSTRYYKHKLVQTLFGEYILIKEFGSIHNNSATGICKNYFTNLDDAIKEAKISINRKLSCGYSYR